MKEYKVKVKTREQAVGFVLKLKAESNKIAMIKAIASLDVVPWVVFCERMK